MSNAGCAAVVVVVVCVCLPEHSLSCTCLRMSGFSKSKRDLRGLLMNSIAGVCPVVGKPVGSVILSAAVTLLPHHFTAFIDYLKDCPKLSAKPFVAGWWGAEVRCLMPFFLMKVWNSSPVNWLPLSLTSCGGRPVRAKKCPWCVHCFSRFDIWLVSLWRPGATLSGCQPWWETSGPEKGWDTLPGRW